LNSALAFSAVTLAKHKKDEVPKILTEHDLYETIVQIPHYQQKQMQLLDKEDEIGVVEDNFIKF